MVKKISYIINALVGVLWIVYLTVFHAIFDYNLTKGADMVGFIYEIVCVFAAVGFCIFTLMQYGGDGGDSPRVCRAAKYATAFAVFGFGFFYTFFCMSDLWLPTVIALGVLLAGCIVEKFMNSVVWPGREIAVSGAVFGVVLLCISVVFSFQGALRYSEALRRIETLHDERYITIEEAYAALWAADDIAAKIDGEEKTVSAEALCSVLKAGVRGEGSESAAEGDCISGGEYAVLIYGEIDGFDLAIDEAENRLILFTCNHDSSFHADYCTTYEFLSAALEGLR